MLEFQLAAVAPDCGEKTTHATLYLFNKQRAIILPIKTTKYKAKKLISSVEEIEIRPSPHLVMYRIIKIFKAEIECVVVSEYFDEIFYCCVRVRTKDYEIYDMDSTPSDALTLAIKAKVPIFVTSKVIRKAGIKVSWDILEELSLV